MQIDGEELFSFPEILDKFGLRETKFFNQLKKNHFGFLDSKGFPHKIDWTANIFADLLNMKKAKNQKEAATLN